MHHPIYAGAYVYGRRPTDVRRKQPGRPGTGRLVAPPEACHVLLKDRVPAYISWEQFARNLRQLAAKTNVQLGVIRQGPSLLAGLVRCGRCGTRMAAAYQNNGSELRYSCQHMAINYGEARCQSLVGAPLDALVARLVLEALEPAALALSLRVAEDLEAERQRLHQHWQQRLERVSYEVERAFRQSTSVEPANRLVARSLERQWEETLAAQQTVQADYTRFLAQQPATLSAQEREAIRRLAADIPAVWHAPTTTAAERQALIRQLVERVVVTVQGESEQVTVEVHWVGGSGTQTTLIRPVARLEQLSYLADLLARVAALHGQGVNRPTMAQILNAEGWRPAKRRATFTAEMVGALLARQGLGVTRPHRVAKGVRKANEWTLAEFARTLAMPEPTLYAWLRKGHVRARQAGRSSPPVWLIWADASELDRLRGLRHALRPRPWPAPIGEAEEQGGETRGRDQTP